MSAPERAPIPAGRVSSIRGRWQVPGLTAVIRAVAVLGLLGAVLPEDLGRGVATVAVAVVVAVPLLRVAWLILRWTQERDWRFVALGASLLLVIAIGATVAAAGVGS